MSSSPSEVQAALTSLIEATRAAEAMVLANSGSGETSLDSIVTFDDVFLNFTSEEWALLTDEQKRLYHSVMLENYMLLLSLGIPVSRYNLLVDELERLLRLLERRARRAEWEANMLRELGLTHAGPKPEPPDTDGSPGPSTPAAPLRSALAASAKYRPPPCNLCNRLVKDVWMMAGEQPAPCQYCGRSFQLTLNLDPGNASSERQAEREAEREAGSSQSSDAQRKSPKSPRRVHFLLDSESGPYMAMAREDRPAPSQGGEPSLVTKYYKCSECELFFRSKECFLQHRKVHARESSESDSESSNARAGAVRKSRRVELQGITGGRDEQGRWSPPSPTGRFSPQTASARFSPPSTSGRLTPQSASGRGSPQSASGRGSPQNAGGRSSPQNASSRGSPQSASGRSSPQNAGGRSSPQNAGGRSSPQSASGRSSPQSTGGRSSPQGTTGKPPKKTSSPPPRVCDICGGSYTNLASHQRSHR